MTPTWAPAQTELLRVDQAAPADGWRVTRRGVAILGLMVGGLVLLAIALVG